MSAADGLQKSTDGIVAQYWGTTIYSVVGLEKSTGGIVAKY